MWGGEARLARREALVAKSERKKLASEVDLGRKSAGDNPDIARFNGYHVTAVGKALKQPWPAVELIIAAALERRPQDI
jgi:hypothetical protein